MFMFLMLCEHMHWKVCIPQYQQYNPKSDCIIFVLHHDLIRLSIHKVSMHIPPPPPPKENFVFNSSAFRLFCLYKYQANTHQRKRRKKEGKKKGGKREREGERENISQSNSNGLQIFWLVRSYSLIVFTVQHFFPPKTCSLQGIVYQTFVEKTVTLVVLCGEVC